MWLGLADSFNHALMLDNPAAFRAALLRFLHI